MKYLIPILLIVFVSCGNAVEVEKNLNGKILKCKSYEKQVVRTIDGKVNTRKRPIEFISFYMFGKEELLHVFLPIGKIKLKQSPLGKYKQYADFITVDGREQSYFISRKDLYLKQTYESKKYMEHVLYNCELLESYQEIEKHFEEIINKRKEIIRKNKI